MKKLLLSIALLAAINSTVATLQAGEAKTYQVTGPVIEVSEKYVIVQKDEDKWQIAADKSMTAKLKKGDKVTIKYQMIATDVESKAAKKDK